MERIMNFYALKTFLLAFLLIPAVAIGMSSDLNLPLPQSLANLSNKDVPIVLLKNQITKDTNDFPSYIALFNALTIDYALAEAKKGNSSFPDSLKKFLSQRSILDAVRQKIKGYKDFTNEQYPNPHALQLREIYPTLSGIAKDNLITIEDQDGQFVIPSLFVQVPWYEGKPDAEVQKEMQEKRVAVTLEEVARLINSLRQQPYKAAHFIGFVGHHALFSVVTDANKKATLYISSAFPENIDNDLVRKYINFFTPFIKQLNK